LNNFFKNIKENLPVILVTSLGTVGLLYFAKNEKVIIACLICFVLIMLIIPVWDTVL